MGAEEAMGVAARAAGSAVTRAEEAREAAAAGSAAAATEAAARAVARVKTKAAEAKKVAARAAGSAEEAREAVARAVARAEEARVCECVRVGGWVGGLPHSPASEARSKHKHCGLAHSSSGSSSPTSALRCAMPVGAAP